MLGLKHHLCLKDLLAVGLLSSTAFSLLPCQSVQASSLQLQYRGQSIIPTGTTFENTVIGGLSSITYNSDLGIYYIISDDRSQTNPARFYTAAIDINQFNESGMNGGVTFTDVTTLLQQNGQPFPIFSLDPEGIGLFNGNSLFISSEGEVSNSRIIDPFVNQFDLDTGEEIQGLSIPAQFIPEPDTLPTTSGVRNNLALESITITPDQRYLFTASENALVQDGPEATLSNGSPSRILQYELNGGQPVPMAQFLYNTDAVALPSHPPDAFKTNGLVELLALDNTGKNFLSLERSFSVGASGTAGNTGNTVKIYQVYLEGATDISGYFSIEGVSGITPARKTLLLDLTSLDIPIDNLEGMTFGPALSNGERSLVLVSDNNFSAGQFTQFLAFSVQSVPEPASVLTFLALGLGALLAKKKSD